jgi:ornithine--oxo-acid transaminase
VAHNAFGFQRLLPMNTGAEAVETGVKLARKWAYEVKGVEPNQARIIFAKGSFCLLLICC